MHYMNRHSKCISVNFIAGYIWTVFILTIALAISCFPLQAAAKTTAKTSTKSTTVRIMIVDTENNGNVQNQVRCLRRVGASYSLVTSKHADIKKYDGLLLPGGGDVNPKYYGAKNTKSGNISNRRDELQIYWVKKFRDAGKPILGICRGAQVINVALGGTLRQHVGAHMARTMRTSFSAGSWLRSIYGASSAITLHYHHQVCSKMGDGLVVTCRSSGNSDVVEGFEHKTLPIYGIQWHPDLMSASFGNKVYKAFLSKCRKYKN